MTIKQALLLLEEHNKWRRGAIVPMQHPKTIGVVIDTILKHCEEMEPKMQTGDSNDCFYTDWMGTTHNLNLYPQPCIHCAVNGGCHGCPHLLLTEAYKKFQQERLKIQ